MNRPAVFCLAVLVAAAALVIPAFRRTAFDTPYYYDEADYMYAGTRGLTANFLDRPSLSLLEFVQKGLELSRDRSKGGDMSRLVRDMGDITFYRHYHGPLYAYWIGLCQMAGVEKESDYRASGLLLHTLAAAAVFFLFLWVFPSLPVWSALLAALAYLLNRTGLVAATLVTQHVLFPLWTALTLFLLGQFRRDLDRRYWYAAAATLGLGFATLESSFILLGAMLLALATMYPRLRIREMAGLTLRGAAVFLTAVLIVWPKGVLQLGLLKGYLYLAYVAVFKKTFTPISPLKLWAHKFTAYPYEFALPALALVAGTLFYRKLACREQAAPFLIYSWLFVCVTMIITAPFTYYHTSLLLAAAVVTGIMAGEFWNRQRLAGGAAATLAAASLVAMAVIYHAEAIETKQNLSEYRAEAIQYVRNAGPGKLYYVPFILVPPIHFYAPQIKTIAVEAAWKSEALASMLSAPGEPKELLCPASQCEQVRKALSVPEERIQLKPVAKASRDLNEPLYSLAIKPGSFQ